MSLGFGATLVPDWFSYVFTYSGDNRALSGFLDAIVLVMETGFAVTAFLAIILNLILPEEDEDEEVESLAGDIVDRDAELELESSVVGPPSKSLKALDNRQMTSASGSTGESSSTGVLRI